MAGENWLSSAEAAARSGKTPRHITRLCEQGKLTHRMENGAYQIDPASLEQLISSPPRRASRKRRDMSENGHNPKSETESSSTSEPEPDLKADMGLSDVQDAESVVRNTICNRDRDVLKVYIEEPAISDIEGHEDMNSLKRSLRFEQARNELMQARLSDLLRQLRISPDALIKSSSRRRRDRRLNWVLALSLMNLLLLIAVLFSISGR